MPAKRKSTVTTSVHAKKRASGQDATKRKSTVDTAVHARKGASRLKATKRTSTLSSEVPGTSEVTGTSSQTDFPAIGSVNPDINGRNQNSKNNFNGYQPHRQFHGPNIVPDQNSHSESEEEDSEEGPFSFPSVLASHTDTLLCINNPTYVEPVATPINCQISAAIQKKIYENKFVDFALLLPSDSISQGNTKFQLQVDADSNISLVPSQKSKKISSVETWTTAFLRFVSVYSVRFPYETPALMKYGEIIRDLSNRRPGAAFIFYDTQFRMLRQSIPHPWDRLHMEFWLLASTQPSSVPIPSQQRPFRGQQKGGPSKRQFKFLENTCWAYNKRGVCTINMCRHPHICGLCRGQHSAVACNNKPRDRPYNNFATATPSPNPTISKTNARPTK